MVTEMLGNTGMGFVVFDQEHGPLSAETTQQCCMGAQCSGLKSIVRVRDNSAQEIQRALDIGADGVQIPQVETEAGAKEAVEAARFSPIGDRGLSQYVRAGDYMGTDEYTVKQNEEVIIILQVEGQRGLNNLEEILSVDGYDALFLGPYDISSSLGLPGEVRHEDVEELMSQATNQANAENIAVGTFADTAEMATHWLETGVDFIEYGIAVSIFGEHLSETISEIEDVSYSHKNTI
jgi:4-hydroxy-2-oxoheptanedioate aldolase